MTRRIRFLLFLFIILSKSFFCNGQYHQIGNKLVGSGAVGSSSQGNFISLSGDGQTLAVGGPWDNNAFGAVWVYTLSGGNWIQMGDKLIGNDGVGPYIYQGEAVSLSANGKTLAVGGSGDNSGTGAIWIYTLIGGKWVQMGNKLVGSGAMNNAGQGHSVSLSSDGTALAFGGPYDNPNGGAIWVYTFTGGNWVQMGNKLVGTGGNHRSYQGWSVSLSSDGKTLAEGGPYYDNGVYTGSAWVFTLSGGNWIQMGNKIEAPGAIGLQNVLSFSLSLSGKGQTLAFGVSTDNINYGAVWVYTLSGGNWGQMGNKLVPSRFGQYGSSVSLSDNGKILAVGSGDLARIYYQTDGIWIQTKDSLVGSDFIGNTYSGSSVSLSSNGQSIAFSGFSDDNGLGAAWVFTSCSPRIVNNLVSQTVCGLNKVTLQIDVMGYPPIKYKWNNGDTTNFITTSVSGIYTVSVSGLCDTVSSVANLLFAGNGPTVTGVALRNPICFGQSTTLLGIGANNYNWSNNIIDGKSFFPLATSEYKVIGLNTNGCSDTSKVILTVHPKPTVTGMATKTQICRGEVTTIFGFGADNYIWSSGLENNMTFKPLYTSEYTVIGLNIHGCSDTSKITVTVNPNPTVTGLATKNPLCAGQATTLLGIGAKNYIWSNGIPNGGSFIPIISSVYTLIGVGNGLCSDTINVEITVYPIPTVSGIAIVNPVCHGQTTTLFGTGAISYSWDNGVLDRMAFVPNSTDIFTLTGTGLGGCSDTASIRLEVDPLLDLLNLKDTSIVCGEIYTLNPKLESTRFLWQDGSTASTLTISKAGTYQVTISNACGSKTDTVNINLKKAILPNVFTPNEDGKNDALVIGNYRPYNGRITFSDRWGETVYQSDNYNNNWKAEGQPDGIYFYSMDTGCEIVKGLVQVLR